MKKWRISCYTVVFKSESSGEGFFHNSFMGAVARVPADKFAEIEGYVQKEIDESDLEGNEVLAELCRNGFFFPSDVEEEQFVNDVLDKEAKAAGFSMILLPHEDCNFRCEYCYEKHERGRMEPYVIEGLKALADKKAQEGRSISVSWFGGEPLLAKDIIYELSDSFISSCDKSGVSFSSSMTTNGYLLSREVADNLLKRKVKRFQVTLDGPEEVHNKLRKLAGGGKTYRIILDNLKDMRSRDQEFYVSIRVNYNNESVVFMDDFFADIADNFDNDPRFGVLFRPISKLGGANDDKINVTSVVQRRSTETDLYGRCSGFGNIDKRVREALASHGEVCYAGKETSIVVGADGTIYKCTVAFNNPLNNVGRINEDGSIMIDRSRWDLWVANSETDFSECASCPLMPACQGKNCPLHAITAKKPVCPLTPEEYKRRVELVAAKDCRNSLL